MLYRYGIDPKTGKQKKIATIYTQKEHKIDQGAIAKEVFTICRRLKEAGYEAYLVGGAVRDLLLHHIPHDFDIATNAEPNQIKKNFKNCRIIGRRFKLCHIFYPHNLIFEVSTFRSATADNFVNDFGTIEEDAHRRDYSINSLYYCPLTQRIFDYTGGVKDIKNKKIRSIIDLNITFKQDPVRMIRGIKYSVLTGFSMSSDIKRAIRRDHEYLQNISVSRMVEELFKILQSGHSSEIIKLLHEYGLFQYILPELDKRLLTNKKLRFQFIIKLHELDQMVLAKKKAHPDKELKKDFQIAKLLEIFIEKKPFDDPYQCFKDLFYQMKALLSPLTPPNFEIEGAIDLYLKKQNLPTAHCSYSQIKEEKRRIRRKAKIAAEKRKGK